jgi:YD repeat-containing protein
MRCFWTRPDLPSGVAATADVVLTYNTATPGNGAVNRVDDGAGFETYAYDSLGRTTSKTRTIDGVNSYQTQYQYNQINQLSLMIYPSGKRVRENLDSRGRMIGEDKVDSGGSVLASYVSNMTYNVAGQVTGMTSGSGVAES